MKFMLFRKLLPLLAAFVVLSVHPASAQLAIYGTFQGQRFGGITCPSFASPCANNNGHVQPYGGSFGAFYDFRDVGPVRLGLDLRGDVLDTNKRGDSSAGGSDIVREYGVLAGVRGGFRTPIRWLLPYAEVAGGYSRSNASGLYTTTTTVNNAVSPPVTTTSLSFNPETYNSYPLFEGFVGLDIRVASFLDIRAVELGGGAAFGSAPPAI